MGANLTCYPLPTPKDSGHIHNSPDDGYWYIYLPMAYIYFVPSTPMISIGTFYW